MDFEFQDPYAETRIRDPTGAREMEVWKIEADKISKIYRIEQVLAFK